MAELTYERELDEFEAARKFIFVLPGGMSEKSGSTFSAVWCGKRDRVGVISLVPVGSAFLGGTPCTQNTHP